MKIEKMCKGCDMKGFTCRSCGSLECSSWWPLYMMKNHRSLMNLDACVCLYEEVLFGIHYFPFDTTGLWLFDLVAPLFNNKGGGSMPLGP